MAAVSPRLHDRLKRTSSVYLGNTTESISSFASSFRPPWR